MLGGGVLILLSVLAIRRRPREGLPDPRRAGITHFDSLRAVAMLEGQGTWQIQILSEYCDIRTAFEVSGCAAAALEAAMKAARHSTIDVISIKTNTADRLEFCRLVDHRPDSVGEAEGGGAVITRLA